MAVMIMKCPDGNTRPLIEVNPEDFEVLQKKYAKLYGIPTYWCKNLGVLPKPTSPDFMFTLKDEI